MMISYLKILSLVLMVPEVLDFDLQCPGSGHWKYRSEAIGCSNSITYYCLFYILNEEYTENCTGPDFDQEGLRRVLRPGFDSEPCSSNRYQPFPFNTTGHSVCVYDKSVCSEEGQIAYDTETTTNDRTCRCDYTKGYAFVTRPRCSCKPSEEDCSCYLVHCDNDSFLSADYQCITKEKDTRDTVCPKIKLKKVNNTNNKRSGLHVQLKGYFKRDTPKIPVMVFWILILALPFMILGMERIKGCLMEDMIVNKLEDVHCIEGQTCVFTCEIRRSKIKVLWFKDGCPLQDIPKCVIIESKEKGHSLTIMNTTQDNNGLYSIAVKNKKSEARLIVRGVEATSEEVNYLRLVHLMLRIATPAVREVFNSEFDPEFLKRGKIFKRNQFKHFIEQNNISEKEVDLILPFKRNPYPSSEKFGLRLMIFLIRNFTQIDIVDILPKERNESIGADLSRLKYYRNKVIHNHGSFSENEFTSYWNDICQVVVRLRKITEENSQDAIDENDPLAKKILASIVKDSEVGRNSVPQTITTDESMYLRIVHLLHREACPVVRVKFDVVFPPLDLKRILIEKQGILYDEKVRKITTAHWDLMYPKTGLPKSTNFSLQLMTQLMWIARKGDETLSRTEWRAIEDLEKYVYKIGQSEGCLDSVKFEKYWNEIVKIVGIIGGQNFKRSTAYLHATR
ncbi:uncharacterized protein LOC127706463 isoform X1 [Mytilus californianus]|uniref:uncharacterized protein LOC127706463 isoform X1 n=1 Tax=Mytilus californianus TaxID=6549 RepID=UPI002247C54F|nr:uncharacterized protein LOC127706463 isoform X1 [Mytilus californianus]